MATHERTDRTSMLIGAGSALLGALLGVAASVIIAIAGFHHDASSRLHDERVAAYSAFLSNALETRNQLERMGLEAERRNAPARSTIPDVRASENNAVVDEVQKQLQGLLAQLASMRIFGEESTLRSATAADTELVKALSVALTNIDSPKMADALERSLARFDKQLDRFVSAARSDLGIPPAPSVT